MSRRRRGNGPKQTPLTGFQKHLIQKFGRGPRCHTMPDPNRRTAAEGDAVGALQKVLEASGQSAEQASQNAQRAVAQALQPKQPKPRPETTPSPGLSLEERRRLVASMSTAERDRYAQEKYGVPAGEVRFDPSRTGSADQLRADDQLKAEARKKRQEPLPAFNARTATVDEVRARI